MKLIDYLRSLPDVDARRAFAARCDSTLDYLYQIAGGHRACGPKFARRIADRSAGAVSPAELRPDIFGEPLRSRKAQHGA